MPLPVDPYQYTLRKTISCCGAGLHSGRTVNLTMKPAPTNNGIRFFRSDLKARTHIHAHMDKVVDTRLATTIANQDFQISTTEHLMAAIKAFGVDNVDVELDSSEVPIMDGSADPFYQLLKTSGKKKQNGTKKVLRITKPIFYNEGDKKLAIYPHNGFKVTGEISFEDTLIQQQKYCFDFQHGKFDQELARARTFGYVEQVEELWANGLALGGSLANVIAIHWNRKSVLNEDGLRYKDEFIRHKVLDLVGDFALLGCPVLGHVVAYKAGHAQHLALMKAIADAQHCWEIVEMKHDGAHSVLSKMAACSKAAGEVLLPFFDKNQISAATAVTM